MFKCKFYECVFLFSWMCVLLFVNYWKDISFFIFNFLFLLSSFQGVLYSNPTPQRSEREREREGVRERVCALKDWSLTNSLGYFDVTLTWFLSGYVLMFDWFLRFLKFLYFRLHCTKHHQVDIMIVWCHSSKKELMWMPKMWGKQREMNWGRECE